MQITHTITYYNLIIYKYSITIHLRGSVVRVTTIANINTYMCVMFYVRKCTYPNKYSSGRHSIYTIAADDSISSA